MALTKAQKASVDARIKAAKARRPAKKKTAKRRRVKTARAAPARRKKAKRSPATRSMPQQALSASGLALHSTYEYARALSDPFNAPLNTGVPMHQLGLPSFKTTRHFRAVLDTAAMTSVINHGGTSYGLNSQALKLSIYASAAGTIVFSAAAGGDFSTTALNQIVPFSVPNCRIVCAAIRITRIGRRDDAGLRYGMIRSGHDGSENYPGFVSSDFFQMNYIPKNNFDLEFRTGATPLNYPQGIEISIAGMLSTVQTFQVDYRIVVESNFDTPPTNIYTFSDWLLTVQGLTRNADTNMLPEQLASISRAAAQGRFVPVNTDDQDPVMKSTDSLAITPSRIALAQVGIQGTPVDVPVFTDYDPSRIVSDMMGYARETTQAIRDINGNYTQAVDVYNDLTNAWTTTSTLFTKGAVAVGMASTALANHG